MIAVIIGFDPFADLDKNPSQLAVNLLAKDLHIDDQIKKAKDKIEFKTLILPTAGDKAWSKLKRFIESIFKKTNKNKEKFVLVLSGYAQSRSLISIERFALNIKDYRIHDNAGKKSYRDYIINKKPDALRSKTNVLKLAHYLNNKGLHCEVSNHAGTFICNEIYYKALDAWQNNKFCQGIIFIHLPSPNLYKALKQKSNSYKKIKSYRPINSYAKALKEAAIIMLNKR
jgi:pyroglutamyl-peptidase